MFRHQWSHFGRSQFGLLLRYRLVWLLFLVLFLSHSRQIQGYDIDNNLRGYIQKFPDWPPGARTASGTALCRWVQLYRSFVSQSSEFCRLNPLCCFLTSVYCCYCLFRYDSVRKLLDIPWNYCDVFRLSFMTNLWRYKAVDKSSLNKRWKARRLERRKMKGHKKDI
jgi:hypothetical protein